jgi:hypothetical protein
LTVATTGETLENIHIFPNPFENFIEIENAQGNEIYELSNGVGQVFFKGKNIETQDFSNLLQGIYFLKINEKRVFKILKK